MVWFFYKGLGRIGTTVWKITWLRERNAADKKQSIIGISHLYLQFRLGKIGVTLGLLRYNPICLFSLSMVSSIAHSSDGCGVVQNDRSN